MAAGRKGGSSGRKTFKEHQVHEMADAKIKESERLRKALKISSNYEEGSHWKRQEERLRQNLERDEKEADDDGERERDRDRGRD